MGYPDHYRAGDIAFSSFGPDWTGYIRPGANLPDGMFRWLQPLDAVNQFDAGGGGAEGLTIIDPTGGDPGRFYDVHSALRFDDAFLGITRDCWILNIKGRALYFKNVHYELDHIHVRFCGNSGNTGDPIRPAIDLDGGGGGVNIRRVQMEVNHFAPYIYVRTDATMMLRDSSFESSPPEYPDSAQNFILGDGRVDAADCWFGRNLATHVVLTYPFSGLVNSQFSGQVGITVPILTVNAGSYQTHLNRLNIFGGSAAGVQPVAFEIAAPRVTASHIELYSCGSWKATDEGAIDCLFNAINFINPKCPSTGYALDIGSNTLTNSLVTGSVGGDTPANGIRTAAGLVQGCTVKTLSGSSKGITTTITTGATARLIGNAVSGVGSGAADAFVYTSGNVCTGNVGFPTTANASGNNTLQSGTLNAENGTIITDETLTTSNGAETIVAITNSLVNASSRVLASVQRGTDSIGRYRIKEVQVGSGVFNVVVQNDGASPLTGSIKVSFEILN